MRAMSNYWIRRAAEALPNAGTSGPWALRLAQGLANLGSFGGSSVGALDGSGHPFAQLWRALSPQPAYGGSTWSQRLAGGGWKALYDAVVQAVADADQGGGGNEPELIASANFITETYSAGGASRALGDIIGGAAIRDSNGLGANADGDTSATLIGALLSDIQAAAAEGDITILMEISFPGETTNSGGVYIENATGSNTHLAWAYYDAGRVSYEISEDGSATLLGDMSDAVLTGAQGVWIGYSYKASGSMSSMLGEAVETAAAAALNPYADGDPTLHFLTAGVRVRQLLVYQNVAEADLIELTGQAASAGDWAAWVPEGALFAFRGDKAASDGVWLDGALVPWTDALSTDGIVTLSGGALIVPEAGEDTSGTVFLEAALLAVIAAAAGSGGYSLAIRFYADSAASFFGLTVQDDGNSIEMSVAGGGGFVIGQAVDTAAASPAQLMDTEPAWAQNFRAACSIGSDNDLAFQLSGFAAQTGVSSPPIPGAGTNLGGSLTINAKSPVVQISGIWLLPFSADPYAELGDYTSEAFLLPDAV